MHIRTDSFLTAQYRIRAGDLDFDPAALLRMVDVSCDGAPWPALGSRVRAVSGDGAFTVRDGVFFKMRPAPAADGGR